MKYMKVFGMMMCYMMIDTQLKLSRQLIIYLQKKAYKKDHNFHIINSKYMYMIWIHAEVQSDFRMAINIKKYSQYYNKYKLKKQIWKNNVMLTVVLWGSTVYKYQNSFFFSFIKLDCYTK